MARVRSKCLTTKVTPEEYDRFQGLAGEATVSAWARDTLRHAAARAPIEQVLLEELMALRAVLLNLHFAIASGAPPTAEEMQRLIERAEAEKATRALARLTPALARRSR